MFTWSDFWQASEALGFTFGALLWFSVSSKMIENLSNISPIHLSQQKQVWRIMILFLMVQHLQSSIICAADSNIRNEWKGPLWNLIVIAF